MVGQILRLVDSVRKGLFIVGTALLIFIAARNSITWYVGFCSCDDVLHERTFSIAYTIGISKALMKILYAESWSLLVRPAKHLSHKQMVWSRFNI